jgi:hypothetical protein
MELEEQRRIQEEKAAKEKRSKELEQARNEKRKQEKREFTARKKAGLLTPEEAEAEEKRLAKKREYNNTYHAKRNAALPPKPPSAKSVLQDIIKRKNADMPLTPEESEIYQAYRDKENEKAREWREQKKASAPPKPPKEKKPTKKEVISDIIKRKNEGLTLTPEEQTAYEQHREIRNAKHKIWRDAKAVDKPPKLYITEIQKRIKEGLELTPEEAAAYDAWRDKKSEYQREWREKNSDYMREWYEKKKANADLPMAVNQ